MQKQGLVLEADDKLATIEVSRASACGSCESCAMRCEEKKMNVIVKNTLGARAGDRVEISTEQGSLLKGLVMFYFVPFVALCSGIALGWFLFWDMSDNKEILSFLLGSVFLAASYGGIKLYDIRVGHEELIKMVSIL